LLVPGTPEERARMDMVIGMLDSYGYGALVGGVAAYHLFPDFVGGKNESMRQGGLEAGRKVIEFAMKTKGDSRFIAGELSLADLYLAPVLFYVSLTPDAACPVRRRRLCGLVGAHPAARKLQSHPAESWLTLVNREGSAGTIDPGKGNLPIGGSALADRTRRNREASSSRR
jgi:glutathione S-transferase